MKIKPAKGTRGYIIRTLDSYVFRVYDKQFNFTDYDILHYDMEVEILDDDAMFYNVNGKDFIDHSPYEEK